MTCVEFRPKRPKAKIARPCPECREVIPAGQRYVRYSGVYDDNLYNGIMCADCYGFLDRYMNHLRRIGQDSIYQQGDIINEAFEHVEFTVDTRYALSLADRRDLSDAFFKIQRRQRIKSHEKMSCHTNV